MNHKCFKCGAEMDKSIESGHTVLKCSICFNTWVSPTPSFMPGSGGDNPPKILIIHRSELKDVDELEEGQYLKERIASWIDHRFDFVLYDFECKIKGENVVVFNINKINEEDEYEYNKIKLEKIKLEEQEDYLARGEFKTVEEMKRIQEKEGFSDEDMEDGAWIDF